MRKFCLFTIIASSAACLLSTGCQKKNDNVWEDNKTASRYKSKLSKSFWDNEESALAQEQEGFIGPSEEDFIPLREEDLKSQFADRAIPQSKAGPGEPGSGVPGIDTFTIPNSQLANIFRNVFFNTDDHILRGKEYLVVVERISEYLKKHPGTYIFVEGHCDERGPEAYNLALGSRRADYIRSLLIERGVGIDQVHTISYGKEKPLDIGHNAQAWSKIGAPNLKSTKDLKSHALSSLVASPLHYPSGGVMARRPPPRGCGLGRSASRIVRYEACFAHLSGRTQYIG